MFRTGAFWASGFRHTSRFAVISAATLWAGLAVAATGGEPGSVEVTGDQGVQYGLVIGQSPTRQQVKLHFSDVLGVLLKLADMPEVQREWFAQAPRIVMPDGLYVPLSEWRSGGYRIDRTERQLALFPFTRVGEQAPIVTETSDQDLLAQEIDDLANEAVNPPIALISRDNDDPDTDLSGAQRRDDLSPLVYGDVAIGQSGDIARPDTDLSLPLLPKGAWGETLAAITINGQKLSDGAFLRRNSEGEFALRVEDLDTWRVRYGIDEILSIDGDAYVVLSTLNATNITFDETTLELSLIIDADRFEPNRIIARDRPRPTPTPGSGAYLDYELQVLLGDEIDAAIGGLAELGVFQPFGVFKTTVLADALGTDTGNVVRLDTVYTRDFPDSRQSLRVGDTITMSSALARPARFGGVQWATNFRTDPTFVTFPRPTIGGLVDQESVVDVIVDNTTRTTSEVPPGPFEIDNVPVLTGAGEIQLRITDLLGREQLVTQPYYVTPRLLRKDLHEFGVQAGFLRENFAQKDFDYGDAFASATYRQGISNALTMEAHGEVRKDVQVAGAHATYLASPYGLFSGGALVSVTDGDVGGEVSADYEYRNHWLSVGARTALTSDRFRQIGRDDEAPPERLDQLSVGLNLGEWGRLGGLAIYETNRLPEPDRLTLTGTYSVPMGPGTFLLSGVQEIEPDTDFVVTASYSMPLGDLFSASTTASVKRNTQRAGVQLNKSRGATDLGLAYRVATEIGDDARDVDASLSYNTQLAGLRADFASDDGDERIRLGVQGSLGMVDGRIRATRRLGRSFGVVSVPGFEDVTVLVDNKIVGSTDEDGLLMVPGLRPYEENRIAIELDDLAFDTEIDRTELTAVPYEDSGVALEFAARKVVRAEARFVDQTGSALPAGLNLVDAAGGISALLGLNGLAYISGAAEDVPTLVANLGNETFACVLPWPFDSEQGDTQLGEISCERRAQ